MPYKPNLAVKSIIIIVILLSLGLYNNHHNGERYRLEQKEHAEWNMDGLYVKSVSDSSFYAESHTDSIIGVGYHHLIKSGDQIRIGDLLKIKSKHIGGDTVQVVFLNVSRARGAKIWLSVIPLFIGIYVFNKYFQFDKSVKRFKVREDA
ncbi:MAG: hypothetical protein KIT33_11130 [Candidatus Kapabacteria bacterium]|nr:hypothetical protein [Ignavibacteriota bacterium]MCW5885510.1 hypothetical protein [Candidatus Kapabacteria bacterium]